MSRFADPHHCPDCRADILPGQPACTSCALPLAGELAQRLWGTLVAADGMLLELRAAAVEPQLAPMPASESGSTSVSLMPQRRTGRRGLGGLGAASVPKILLGLGALCVLVAAVVFLAVTWAILGVGARTVALVALTLACGTAAAWLARRDLRGGAEALALVALGLLTLDVLGARQAGWLGDLGDAPFLLVLGLLLVGVAGGAAVAARRTPVSVLRSPQLVAGVGTAVATLGVATLFHDHLYACLVAAVLLAAVVTAAAVRTGLVWTRWSALAVTVLTWVALLGSAFDRAERYPTFDGLWLDLHVWPLLAAAALAGGVALLPRVARVFRVGAAAVAYAVLVLALAAPAFDESSSLVAWVAMVALLVTAVVSRWAPAPWRVVGLLVQGGAGMVVLYLGIGLAGLAGLRLASASRAGWSGTLDGRLAPLSVPGWVDLPDAWMLPLLVLALLGTAYAAVQAVRAAYPDLAEMVSGPWTRLLETVAAAATAFAVSMVAAALVATLALYPVPVWSVVALAATLAAAALGWWLRTGTSWILLLSGLLLAGSVVVSRYDDALMAVTLTVAVAMVGVVPLRATDAVTSAVAGALVACSLAGGVWTWALLLDAAPAWAAAAVLVALASAVLLVQLVPDAAWSHRSPSTARVGWEAGAAGVAVPFALAGVSGTPDGSALTWTAVYLTLAGATVTALALLRTDRQPLLPVGALLLAAASWVRLWEIGVREPEPYTLPTAALLAAVGLLRLHRTPEAATAPSLSPALGLALVPSLLWALGEGPGLRSLLLGLGCLGLLAVGAGKRWSAPLTWGAVVGTVLVLSLSAPYIGDAVPRWALIGGAGVLLMVTGVTWERRMQEARTMIGHVRALR